MSKPDFKSLEKKLARGMALERAASEAGIDLAEAKNYLETRRLSAVFDDDTLRITAGEALHYGIKRLIAATKEKERIASESETHMSSGSSTSYETTDVDAAKALVKFALDAQKLLNAKKVKETGKDDGQNDLFDAVSSSGNWQFKE